MLDERSHILQMDFLMPLVHAQTKHKTSPEIISLQLGGDFAFPRTSTLVTTKTARLLGMYQPNPVLFFPVKCFLRQPFKYLLAFCTPNEVRYVMSADRGRPAQQGVASAAECEQGPTNYHPLPG